MSDQTPRTPGLEERLRDAALFSEHTDETSLLLLEAADEIADLTERNRKLEAAARDLLRSLEEADVGYALYRRVEAERNALDRALTDTEAPHGS